MCDKFQLVTVLPWHRRKNQLTNYNMLAICKMKTWLRLDGCNKTEKWRGS